MGKIDETKRSFLKMLLAAGTALARSAAKKSQAQRAEPEKQTEILYQETKAFRDYYESLKN